MKIPDGRDVGKPVVLRDWQKDTIRQIYDGNTRFVIISFARKNAKALALDTEVPTPGGFKTIRELREGDTVFDSDGKPTRIAAKSPVFIKHDCYEVEFSTGETIVADAGHRWWTETYQERRAGAGPSFKTTEQVAGTLYRDQSKNERNHRAFVAPPIEQPEAELGLDPYAFGAWLGDGRRGGPRLTLNDGDADHFVQRFEQVGLRCRDQSTKRDRESNCRVITWAAPSSDVRTEQHGAVLRQIRAVVGVPLEKRIAPEYLRASKFQRLALLQGLLDTDGTVVKGSGPPRVWLASVYEELAESAVELIASLGFKPTIAEGRAKLNGKDCGPVWRVSFTAYQEDNVFSLPRKNQKLKRRPCRPTRASYRQIVAVRKVESVPTQCIAVESETRQFLVGRTFVPTGNSALSAMILLAHLVGPEARANSQIYSAARSRDQAALVFNYAKKMIYQSPELRDRITVKESAKELHCGPTGSFYKAISADASTAMGFNPSLVIHDELGQVRGPKDDLYDALETSMGAQEEPLSIVISTQAQSDNDLLSRLIDDAASANDPATKLFLYAADEADDPWSEATWHKANPALGDFLSFAEMKRQAEKAKRMPAQESSFRNLNLNQRITGNKLFCSPQVWHENGNEPDMTAFDRCPVYVGLDLSTRNDLTAMICVAVEPEQWHVKSYFWLPAEGLDERARADRVPYDLWAKSGELLTTPGASVDYGHIVENYLPEILGWDLRTVAFDRWRIEEFKKELARFEMELPLVPFGQGSQSMTPAIDILQAKLADKKIRHGMHPVLAMCNRNTVMPAYSNQGGRVFRKMHDTDRIDGMVALAMACGSVPLEVEKPPTSRYESEGLLLV